PGGPPRRNLSAVARPSCAMYYHQSRSYLLQQRCTNCTIELTRRAAILPGWCFDAHCIVRSFFGNRRGYGGGNEWSGHELYRVDGGNICTDNATRRQHEYSAC